MKETNRLRKLAIIGLVVLAALGSYSVMTPSGSAQELPEVKIGVVVPNMAFSAVWVAEQLNYFQQEGVKAQVVVADACLQGVVARSLHFCAGASDNVVLARLEGAPVVAIQAHNRTMTLSITVRKEIADRFKLTRESPLEERLKAVRNLGTIGGINPGGMSSQIFKFLVKKAGGEPEKLKFIYIGGRELPAALMNNLVDAFALSPPSGEKTEIEGKGYVLIPLSRGEVAEVTEYPYEILFARQDLVEKEPRVARAVARAVSRGGALFHTDTRAAKAAVRAHRFFNPKRLDEAVFDLSFALIKDAIPRWGDMSREGWQKVLSFAVTAGTLKQPEKAPSAAEGVLWTNNYVGKGP